MTAGFSADDTWTGRIPQKYSTVVATADDQAVGSHCHRHGRGIVAAQFGGRGARASWIPQKHSPVVAGADDSPVWGASPRPHRGIPAAQSGGRGPPAS